MLVKIPDQGKTIMARMLLGQWIFEPGGARVKLYQNGADIVAGTVPADLVEATFGGYAPLRLVDLNPVDQGIDPLTGADVWAFDLAEFTATLPPVNLPQAIYGYYVTWVDPTDSVEKLLWGQRFDAALTITAASRVLRFTLSFSLTQGS